MLQSNRSIDKRFLMDKLKMDIGLKFCNFCSEMVKNCGMENSLFLGISNSLLMDLGQDQL